MGALDDIRNALPDYARDIKLNLQAVLTPGALGVAQVAGVAVASAATARNPRLLDAVLAEARALVDPGVIEDGLAAAALMGMNNVYYRFRHMIGKPSYRDLPARLRMNRLAKPATQRVDFELYSLAASAINGCEACVQAHERVVLEGGMTEEQVHDAVRIAATIHAAAIALEAAAHSATTAQPPQAATM